LNRGRTPHQNPKDIERRWLLIDAAGRSIGRLARDVATLLRGKHKAAFSPHLDCGDFVVVINAAKVRLTGNSKAKELVYRHTLYPGGLRSISRGDELKKNPAQAVRRVVSGMLPKNPLGRKMLSKLKVYPGPDHPHEAQKPIQHEFSASGVSNR
jgi:large subunit ribosomal protein L13